MLWFHIWWCSPESPSRTWAWSGCLLHTVSVNLESIISAAVYCTGGRCVFSSREDCLYGHLFIYKTLPWWFSLCQIFTAKDFTKPKLAQQLYDLWIWPQMAAEDQKILNCPFTFKKHSEKSIKVTFTSPAVKQEPCQLKTTKITSYKTCYSKKGERHNIC